jgi:hypothetical protein
MVEILKRGIVPEEVHYETICVRCKTHFRFLRKEARQVNDFRDGDFLSIDCPVCNSICTKSL